MFTIIRKEITARGGGIEINLEPYGFKDENMTAYQNYLGGGMLGGIGNDCTIQEWRQDKELISVAEKLRKYFAELMDIDYDEHESLPLSAY